MPQRVPDAREQRVLLLTPTQRDGELSREMLAEAGVTAQLCRDLPSLLRELDAPVGAVILTEESLAEGGMEALEAWVDAQPPWSDLPVIVLVRTGASSAVAEGALHRLGNVTLLERPIRVATFLSAVRAALRGRGRQYQTREHLIERIRSNELLESRVAERTAVAEQRTAELRALASELSQAEMRERRRLAQVLHDHLQQLLVAAQLSLRMALNRVDDGALKFLRRADDLISETIKESRSLTVELSPPILYEGGLAQALAWLGRWMGEKHGLRVELEADPKADPASEQARVLLFQAVRELLFNVVKHANVAAATVTLESDGGGGARLRVADRGTGFASHDEASAHGDHFGLFSIRERLGVLGGTFQIASSPGEGTTATLHLAAPAVAPPAGRQGAPKGLLPEVAATLAPGRSDRSDTTFDAVGERRDTRLVEEAADRVSAAIGRPGATVTAAEADRQGDAAHRTGSGGPSGIGGAISGGAVSGGGDSGGGGGRISVLLADDHEILRKGLAGLLAEEPGIEIVAEASDGCEAVELAERLQPDVVVMDVTMPGLSGVEATRRIVQRLPHVRIIGLSMHSEHDMSAAMQAAGAAAYLTKGGSATALVRCIKAVAGAGSARA